jgi:CheY-like chemotaxis protein
MDGLALCRLVKSDPSLGKPWVVLLTARSKPGYQAGMNAAQTPIS